MSKEQGETRKEKLRRLLAANKTKHEREQLIRYYRRNFGSIITMDQFVELDQSRYLKQATYQKIWHLPGLKITDWRAVQKELEQIRVKSQAHDEDQVILYYWDTAYTGGIYILLKEIWPILLKGEEALRADMLAIERHLTFGITVEVEDYRYSLVYWGLNGAGC
jgi:hypothetical protein